MRPFLGAVNGWSQVLGLLITRLPTPAQRLVAIENLVDEHGHGDLSMSHVATFRRLIKSLDNVSGRAMLTMQQDKQEDAAIMTAAGPTIITKDAKSPLLIAIDEDSVLIKGDDCSNESSVSSLDDHHLKNHPHPDSLLISGDDDLLSQTCHPAVAGFLDVFKGTTSWQELAGALGTLPVFFTFPIVSTSSTHVCYQH